MRVVLRIALGAALAAGLGSASCVPASEPLPEAGALGFAADPSPATRGEPFLTSDGWTVRVEALVLQVTVSVQPVSDSFSTHGGYDQYRFDATRSAELFARGVDVGLAAGSLSLNGSYVDPSYGDVDDGLENLGIEDAVVARFRRPAEVTQNQEYASNSGPSMLLAVRAEKNGRVVTLDLTIALPSNTSADERHRIVGEVRADELTSVSMSVAAESLFIDEANGGGIGFDDFALADVNGNGVISGPELASAQSTCWTCPQEQEPETVPVLQPGSLFLVLLERSKNLFVMR